MLGIIIIIINYTNIILIGKVKIKLKCSHSIDVFYDDLIHWKLIHEMRLEASLRSSINLFLKQKFGFYSYIF